MKWLAVRWVGIGRYIVLSEHKTQALALAQTGKLNGVVPDFTQHVRPTVIVTNYRKNLPWQFKHIINPS